MSPNTSNEYEIAKVTIKYEDAHRLLGHPGKNKLLGTSDRLK